MANPPPSIKQQAAQAANAAVPTVKSIYGQYGQSMQDAGGFTQALMHILGQQPGLGSAYNSAIGQEQGVDSAAANRIAAVTGGMPTAASSTAAVGGLADSALSHLIANQGAAKAYAAQLPVAAAARGALENASLITARNQALQTRAQDRTQAFNSALGQAQQNALALREFNINTGLKQQQMGMQQNQFNRTLAAENQRYFAGLNNQRFLYGLRYGGTSGTSVTSASLLNGMGLTKATGLSAAGVNSEVAKADALLQPAIKSKATAIYGYQNPQTGVIGSTEKAGDKFPRVIIGYKNIPTGGGGDPVSSGVPFSTALRTLEGQGIPAPIAFYATAKLYAQGVNAGAQPGNAAYNSFVEWMAQNGFQGYQRQLRQRQRQSGGPQNAGLPQ